MTQKSALPGDVGRKERLAQMLRVNHAGEYGAKRIYAGQLAVLKDAECAPTIQHMAEQEEQHLAAFDTLLVERQVRPTVLTPFWHVAGFALGAATALMGERAAMACTVAVEEVIDEHYADQIAELEGNTDEAALKDTLVQFREEELEHRDIGLEHGAEEAPAYPLLSAAIKGASKTAIWLSTRF